MNITNFIDLVTNDKIVAFVSYAGFILSIYFGYKTSHKIIKYAVAKKGDEYILLFWNASRSTIFYENLFYFYAYGNVNCICKQVYSTDPDISLNIRIGEKETLNDTDRQILNTQVKKYSAHLTF